MKKLNMFVGKLQPITKGHVNCIEEGEELCIVYRIDADDKVPETLKGWKVKGKIVRKEAINNVVSFLNNNGQGDLSEQEKELVKRPFTNDLIDKELEIVKKNTKNILEVVPVKNMYDALDRFNAFCTEHQDEYEPCYWMCGDDRVDNYSKTIGQYDELETELGSGKKLQNILKGKLQTNTGKGRTEGVSGTEVRKSIINKDKATFEKIMPNGVVSMFDDFIKAFENFKDKLQNIKEGKMLSLKDYIVESKGEHDNSQVYDDLYSDVEKHLKKWGAGPVYGWKGDKGIAFSVSKGKNVEKDDWITIVYNREYDDLLITLSKFGTDDIDDAKAYEDNVYAGQEPEVIDELLNK